jgi:hypothetical protein
MIDEITREIIQQNDFSLKNKKIHFVENLCNKTKLKIKINSKKRNISIPCFEIFDTYTFFYTNMKIFIFFKRAT